MKELLNAIRIKPCDTVWLVEPAMHRGELVSSIVDTLFIKVEDNDNCNVYYYSKDIPEPIGYVKLSYNATDNKYNEEGSLVSYLHALELSYLYMKNNYVKSPEIVTPDPAVIDDTQLEAGKDID